MGGKRLPSSAACSCLSRCWLPCASRRFRDFIEAQARVTINSHTVEVAFGKRAHSPLLLAAGFQDTDVAVPWWGGRKLKISFG